MTKKQKVLIAISALAGVAVVAGVIILVTVLLPGRQSASAPAETGGPAQQKPQAAVDQDGFRVYPREARYTQIKPSTVLPPVFTKWVRSTDFNKNDAIPVLDSWGDFKIFPAKGAVSDAIYGLNAVYSDSKDREIWFRVVADRVPWEVLIEGVEGLRPVGPALCGIATSDDGLECFAMTAEADIHISFDTLAVKNTFTDEEVVATFQAALDAYRAL